MTKDLQLRLLPEEAANDDTLRAVVARETGDAPDRADSSPPSDSSSWACAPSSWSVAAR